MKVCRGDTAGRGRDSHVSNDHDGQVALDIDHRGPAKRRVLFLPPPRSGLGYLGLPFATHPPHFSHAPVVHGGLGLRCREKGRKNSLSLSLSLALALRGRKTLGWFAVDFLDPATRQHLRVCTR